MFQLRGTHSERVSAVPDSIVLAYFATSFEHIGRIPLVRISQSAAMHGRQATKDYSVFRNSSSVASGRVVYGSW